MPSMLLYLPISFIFALEREFALAPGNFSDQLKIVLAGELTSFRLYIRIRDKESGTSLSQRFHIK